MDAIAGTTTRYYYDDQRVAVQTLVSGSVESDFRYYVFGNYIDEVLVMGYRYSSSWIDFYYGHDHLYSPAVMFGPNGMVIERYEYDAYGQVQVLAANYELRTTNLYGNPYYFTGRELDTLDAGSLHLMYYRARTYDPDTGRFMQRDPLMYVDGMNLYEYVRSNPINNSDPYGLMSNRSPHSPHIEKDWDTSKFCKEGCYAHCYSKSTITSYTGTLVGHELIERGLILEVIKAILEGIARGTGGGLAPGSRVAYPVIFEERRTLHMYYHYNCKTKETYRERHFEGTTYDSIIDYTTPIGSVWGRVDRGGWQNFRNAIHHMKPHVDLDWWYQNIWQGTKFDNNKVQYCVTNNNKNYEFPLEYHPGPGLELVKMFPADYYKP